MRVLVVEDEAQLAQQLQSALQGAGFAVDLADNGVDAEHLGSVEPYAAIVLDIGLPRRDGLAVLAAWRRQGMDRPVLLLTARASWQERCVASTPGPTTIWPSPSRWRNWCRACAR